MQTTATPGVATPGIFTGQFWLLSLSSFLFFASFNMLIPELPTYLTSMGGAEYKGFIISLFTLTAGLSRPFSGRLTDRIGRIPVMAFGSLVCFVCGFLYPVFITVVPFLLLRLGHGFSTGFKPTGTAAYIADIVPAHRRGEALGVYGMSVSIGAALGPAIGSWIAAVFSLNALFYTSSFLAFLSIGILINMKETLKNPARLSWEAFRITRKDVFEPRVLPPSLVVFLTYFSFGAVLTLIPDFSDSLGLRNHGLYFLVYTLTSLFIRLVAGRVSDRYGRVEVVVVGCINLIVAMLCTGFATSPVLFFTGAVFFGFATGILSPILTAWTVDLSEEDGRGRAMATMYISMEAGIGLGAYLAAAIFANEIARLPLAFSVMAALGLTALVYSVVILKMNRKNDAI
ncbi:MFS transporter [Salmonirosea aquatica]|uniref:MFS transporter n=1 Tax=Salmonirosea aquatica TaxID=2654236 RepID=A0A7C9FNV6_9BACT|nr:MFS transporter [Cytophagaceae bacterium SJW1-29]